MRIDLRAAFENEPPALDFIWPGFLSGTVGALVAPGATGKSFWALEAAMSVACGATAESGVAGGDLIGLSPVRSGRVIYFAGEDPEAALMGRIHAIGKHLGQQAREAIVENLNIEVIMGKRLNVMEDRHLTHVIELCTNTRLVVLDTLSRIHCMDENSNSDMARLVATLEHVASRTGASILYLHHVSKGSAREGQIDQQQAARGASALIDNARWCGFIAKMSEDEAKRLSDHTLGKQSIGNDGNRLFVRFGVSKQNYGVTSVDHWYLRHSGGVLLPANLLEVKPAAARGHCRVQA